ncbi:hypothetical protein NX059_011733 [Plenodomus lindquistii]|nr:hypothetical protein NX059_011733 [Plenodomus lindquistii]
MIGKLVVSFANPDSLIRVMPSPPKVHFDPNACYVITGALGGLGQSLVRWMVDRGATHLALLSRRHMSSVSGAQDLIQFLASRDIHVECFSCDVSKKDQVMHVIQEIASKHTIKGVVHATTSYLDLTFDKLSASRWNESLSAEVEGTKNLHEAVRFMPLDFFVMTTSALSVYAFPTQAAYTAANKFRDAFARYRRHLGLPASTVSFSLIGEISDVGTKAATVNLFERNKAPILDESRLLALLEPAFLDNRTSHEPISQQWFGQEEDPLSAANLHTYLDPMAMMARQREDQTPSSATLPRWCLDGRVSHIMPAFSDAQRQSAHSEESSSTGSKVTATSIRKEFTAIIREGTDSRPAAVSLVQEVIIHAVAEMLFVDVEAIDAAKSVADMGVDNLIAAELRNWFLQVFGTNISLLDLLDPNVSISTRAVEITDKALDEKA